MSLEFLNRGIVSVYAFSRNRENHYRPTGDGWKALHSGMRVTVGTITGLVASGASFEEILELYPYLQEEDLRAALAYAAWRSEEHELHLPVPPTKRK